jgi:uncharacterized protein YkwD
MALKRITVLLILALAVLPFTALADVVGVVNDVRLHGCPGSPGVTLRLRENSRLDEAARILSRGNNLHVATQRAGYRAVASTAARITNVPNDHDLQSMVAKQFCSQLLERNLREIGAYRRGPDVWFVVAAPFLPPTAGERAEISRRVLELTNLARSRARRCGRVAYPPAPPLILAPTLERAALEHSQDMAAHDDLNHTGHDGSSPADRVRRTGYQWRLIGENLASGVMTAEEAVNGWIDSPPHCENLMTPQFTQMAVSYAVNASSAGGIFWTQVFGTPR